MLASLVEDAGLVVTREDLQRRRPDDVFRDVEFVLQASGASGLTAVKR